MGCHSDDTQVLTPEGIKDWREIKIGDKIYGVDKDFNFKETTVQKIFKYKYKGQMIRFYNNNCYDLLVTPNHMMIFRKNWKKEFEYIPATELFNNFGQIPSVFNWISDKKTLSIKHLKYSINDFLQIIAWYITEGNIVRNRGKPTSFQIRNAKYKKEIQELLKKMGLKYGLYDNSKFIISEPVIAEYLRINCREYAENKTIPDEILSLTKEKLKIFYETLMKGDGYQTNKMSRYYTCSFSLVEKFIILSLKLGYHVNYKNRGKRLGGKIRGRQIKSNFDSYEIGVQRQAKGYFTPFKDKNYHGHRNIELQNYNGMVWCFKTDTQNFFTARKGKISFSGNSGKTLATTHLGWKNWFTRKMKIYSNYKLYKVPYYYLETIKQIDYCKDGAVLLDEFWRLCDSRLSRKTSNKIVTDVLARSRKRHLVYIFTAQVIDTIDKRIRKTTDFVTYPMLFRGESTCKCLVFRTGYPRNANYMKTFYFDTSIPFSIFNSNEEVDMVDDTDSEDPIPEPKLMWQEGAAKCKKCGFIITMLETKCPQCDSVDFEIIEPIYFNSWEEADKHAEKFWEKKVSAEQIEDIED